MFIQVNCSYNYSIKFQTIYDYNLGWSTGKCLDITLKDSFGKPISRFPNLPYKYSALFLVAILLQNFMCYDYKCDKLLRIADLLLEYGALIDDVIHYYYNEDNELTIDELKCRMKDEIETWQMNNTKMSHYQRLYILMMNYKYPKPTPEWLLYSNIIREVIY